MTFRRGFLAAIFAGAAGGLGHAPFDLWPLALLGFLVLIRLVAETDRPGRIAWAGGLGYFALTLHWIVQPFLVDVARHGWMAPFALVFVAAGLALFWGVAGWLSARAPLRALAFAILLGAAEMARGYVLTGFPWALPAYVWTETPVRLTAAWFGPFGLTLLTLLLVALPSAFRVKGWVAAVAGLGVLFGLGTLGDGPGVVTDQTVRLVQPNAPQHEKWDPEKGHIFVDRQIDFTRAEGDVDLVVWPESAIPYWLDTAAPVLSRIAQAADGPMVVLGLNRRANGLLHNALITLPKSGLVDTVYDKVHLVPFGEYIPFGQLAKMVGLRSFAARDGYGFSPGPGVRLIDTPLGRALPLICYEAIFPQQIHAAPSRPDYLLQITNDAWFGTFSGPYQHLQQARFRAAEQGLPLVRVANTGVSAMIDARGNIRASLPLGEAGYIDAPLPEALPATLYARTGDWPLAVILFFTVGALILPGRRNAIANRGTTS